VGELRNAIDDGKYAYNNLQAYHKTTSRYGMSTSMIWKASVQATRHGTEHLFGWGHWIESTILLRPELRFERSHDNGACDNGTKKNQLVFAGDVSFLW